MDLLCIPECADVDVAGRLQAATISFSENIFLFSLSVHNVSNQARVRSRAQDACQINWQKSVFRIGIS